MKISFREAKLKDKDFIVLANKEINTLSGLNYTRLEENIDKDLFEDKLCKAIIAEEDERAIGFILYSYIYWADYGKGIYLSQAYIKSEFRKQGIFKMLLSQLEQKEKDCKFVTNLVGNENETMMKSMDKLNFNSYDLITYYKLFQSKE